jgi:molybdopterin-guanine dinucleotide biosynthesis protein A
MNETISFKILILAGGQSSRMGSPKHLLPVPSTNEPLYKHLAKVICAAFPETHTVHLSIAEKSALDDALESGELLLTSDDKSKHVGLRKIQDGITQDIGPAAGLLAAHRSDPKATWLIVACDFPLLDPAALRQLREAYETPMTCFVNADGFSEPLLAIWSPQALQKLDENVSSGRSGPNHTVKQLGGKLVSPTEEDWILNTNTREEWNTAKCRIKQPQSEVRL